MRKEKGITLIALIITIIIMLILVGVTVNVALNGGLFSTAKEAANKTQYEVDYETLQAGIIGALNEALELPNADVLKNNLPSDWKVTGADGGAYTVTSLKGNKFKVERDGTITEIIARNSTELERYIFGKEGFGRTFTEIFDETNYAFLDDPATPDFDESSWNIGLSNFVFTDDENSFYIKQGNKTYKFNVIIQDDGIITDSTKEISLIYEPKEETKIGKHVQYDGKNWIVLYDDNTNGLQMISENVLEEHNVCLGGDDPTVDESKVEDIDGDGSKSHQEKAVYSYNHAIETLNKKCESLVTPKAGVIKGVRSVGSNPTNPNSENKTLFESENLKTWQGGMLNKKIYSTDYNYENDLDIMIALGANEATCWLASRYIEISETSSNSIRISFCMRQVSSSSYGTVNIFYVEADSFAAGTSYGGVRPVIMLENGALDGLAGEGTAENPWILE